MSNRSINAQEIRPYKVEIFGLQDDYIGTLQSFEDSFLGQIVEPRLVVKDDGTQTFTCRIPKFYIDPKTNNRTPNPRWQDAEANVLAENIRVLKVFIRTDGKPENDKVYPMIIDTITDRRDSHFAVYKYIEASGLAFAELGKQGYKLELTSFTIEDENTKAAEKAEAEGDGTFVFIEPTIQYWLDKVFPRDENGKWLTPWCYEIRMDYSHYAESRESDQVYEDAYVNGWDVVNEALVPTGTEQSRIKARYIECSNSNKYNITQDIAQAFGVFCRYEYKTDLNGKFVREWTENNKTWTGKKVIFYNKAIKSENPYVIDYEKNLQTIERKSEGSNIYSKLYVKPIEASNMTNGYVTIADVAANPTYDEFILNFDYLKNVGAVKDWQLSKVKDYEVAIREKNTELAHMAPTLEKLQVELNECEAKVALNEKQIQSTQENITRYETLRDGTPDLATRSKNNPRRAAICKDTHGNYYIEFNSFDAVQLNTIAAYLNYPTEEPKVYKDGETILWQQDWANFQTYNSQESPLWEPPEEEVKEYAGRVEKGELKKNFVCGPEPEDILEFGKELSFYAVLDDDGFLRKLYFNMSQNRKTALVNQFGDPESTDEATRKKAQTWQLYIVFAYRPRNKYEARVQQYEALLKSLQGSEAEPGGTAKALKAACDAKEAAYKNQLAKQEGLLAQKEALNQQLENILGPALREGYWNPSEYKGVSQPHNEVLTVKFDANAKEGEEDLTYYYEGVEAVENNTKTFRQYLKIDDYSVLKDKDLSNLSIILTPKEGDKNKTLTLFNGPNAGFEIIFSQAEGENNPISRIMIFNIEKKVLDKYKVSAQYKFTYDNNTEKGDIVLNIQNCDDSIHQVWPRIKIEKDNVQYNADTLVISKPVSEGEEAVPLERFYDYYYHIENGRPIYTLKISTNQIFNEDLSISDEGVSNLTYNVSYETSAANEMLYLDARQVAKDNSIPRYSYSLTLSNLPHDFKHIDLSQLVYINDYSLGIHAATGYVNEITYHLDEPWEDEINVQNYKTKFEDLFNTIVAQSEAMKNGQPAISNVVSNFGADGTIKGSVIQTALANNDFYFNYSSTGVEITPTDGIILTNNKPYANGVYGQIVLQGGGIFISNSEDENGNRIWSTGITPDGINANLLTAGQINTDLIKIYAGDDVAFSWNKDGIYAYCDDGKGGYNDKSYVRFSKEGLHATQDGKDLVYLTWDGLYMRNKNGARTFELDTDGNILMSGTLQSFDYRPGINGAGWRIDRQGNAEFNNVQVRGTIAASVFRYDETTAVGGEVWVAPTLIIDQDKEKPAKIYWSSTTKRLILENVTPFVGKDRFNLAGRVWAKNDIVGLNGKIVDTKDKNNVYEFKNLRVRLSESTFTSTDTIYLGSEITCVTEEDAKNIQIYDADGNPTTFAKTGIPLNQFIGTGSWHLIYLGSGKDNNTEGILITAMKKDGPYIDVFDDEGRVSRPIKTGPVVRLGKLDGLKDIEGITKFFTPTGYGLYSDNVYLTGTIFANAGNFGGLEISEKGLTSNKNLIIAAGQKFEVNAASAFFNVSNSGSFEVKTNDGEGIIVNNTGLTVNGKIYATGGQIGSLTIEDVEKSAGALSLVIESSGGLVYSEGVNTTTVLTAKVLKGGAAITSWPNSITQHTLYIEEDTGSSHTNIKESTSAYQLSSNSLTMVAGHKYKAKLTYISGGKEYNIESDVVSFAMAAKGKPGKYVTSISEQYKATSNDKSKPSITDSDWTNTIPANYNATNKYLWAKVTETFSDGTTGEPYVTLRSTWGDTGDAGNDAVSYSLVASSSSILVDLNNQITPSQITFTAYKITGSNAREKYNLTAQNFKLTSTPTATLNSSISNGIGYLTNNYATMTSLRTITATLTVNSVPVAIITIPIELGAKLRELGEIPDDGRVIVSEGRVLASSIAAHQITAGKMDAGAIQTGGIASKSTLYLLSGIELPSYGAKTWSVAGVTKTWNNTASFQTALSEGLEEAWGQKDTIGVKLDKSGFWVKASGSSMELSAQKFSATANNMTLTLDSGGLSIGSSEKIENSKVSINDTTVNAELVSTQELAASSFILQQGKTDRYKIVIGTEDTSKLTYQLQDRIIYIKVPKENETSSGTTRAYSYKTGSTRDTTIQHNNKENSLPLSGPTGGEATFTQIAVSIPIHAVPDRKNNSKWGSIAQDVTFTVYINDTEIGTINTTLKGWDHPILEASFTVPSISLGDSLKLSMKHNNGTIANPTGSCHGWIYYDSDSVFKVTAQ